MTIEWLPRSTTRAAWKKLWREARIWRREVLAAQADCLIFGTGALLITEAGPRHIAPDQLSFTR